MTVLDNDGDYNVYLNVSLSWEEQRAAYKHEMRHIKFGDFFSLNDIQFLEQRAEGE